MKAITYYHIANLCSAILMTTVGVVLLVGNMAKIRLIDYTFWIISVYMVVVITLRYMAKRTDSEVVHPFESVKLAGRFHLAALGGFALIIFSLFFDFLIIVNYMIFPALMECAACVLAYVNTREDTDADILDDF